MENTTIAASPLDIPVREIGYSYDLLYDIKTPEQLHAEVEYLAHRLGGIARLCRDDGYSIDEYILTVMSFPNTEMEKQNAASEADDGAIAKAQASAANESEG